MTADYNSYHLQGRTAEFSDVYERARARAVLWTLERLARSNPPAMLLDLGSGEGRYLPLWKSLFPAAKLLALEYSSVAVRRSASRYPFARHLISSGESIPIRSESVDALVSIEVIEHVPDGARMLSECWRVVKPGGWALISTPCGNTGSLEWWINFLNRDLQISVDGGMLFGRTEDPTHVRRYRSAELLGACEAVGYAAEKIYYRAHCFEYLACRLDYRVKGRINLKRRSEFLDHAFNRLVDGIAAIDWILLRRLPWAATMLLLVRKPDTA